ncbi:hypothetical protein REPUB_Repub08aG0108800 [Reevesia pubescens]
MKMSSIICIAGWLIIYLALGHLSLDFGRFLTGYAIGVHSYVVAIAIGLLVAYTIGALVAGMTPSAIMIFGHYFIPESPRWLAVIGCHNEFHAALQKLHGDNADVSGEEAEIQVIARNMGSNDKFLMATKVKRFVSKCLSEPRLRKTEGFPMDSLGGSR